MFVSDGDCSRPSDSRFNRCAIIDVINRRSTSSMRQTEQGTVTIILDDMIWDRVTKARQSRILIDCSIMTSEAHEHI